MDEESRAWFAVAMSAYNHGEHEIASIYFRRILDRCAEIGDTETEAFIRAHVEGI